jgi:hypothetical protein
MDEKLEMAKKEGPLKKEDAISLLKSIREYGKAGY